VGHHHEKLSWQSQEIFKGALWAFWSILDLDIVVQRKISESGDKWLSWGQINYTAAYL
jgi:hypothetical protein